ncbi:MAG: MBL fold metallo-hydrolase [Hyphomicrobiales bacterium]
MAMDISRRTFLAGSAAATGAMAFGCLPLRAEDKTVHALTLGEIKLSVFSDSIIDIPAASLATNVPPEKLSTFLEKSGFPTDRRISDLNVTLVQTEDDLVVIDTGSGMNFVDSAGTLADNMDGAGIDREKVTKVILTHAHPDHVWGIIDDFEEAKRFPNAAYFMSAAEWDFWMDKEILSKLPKALHGFAIGAKNNLNPVAEKLTRVDDNATIAPGITMISTPGHTPGHMSVMVESGTGKMLVLGDAITHPAVSFVRPDWAMQNDQNQPLAGKTRARLLDMLATDKIPVIGYHLPWPGVGHVERKGAAYTYVAG